MPSPWLQANERSSVGNLAQHIKAREVKLVAIDNLGTVLGGVDENSSEMIQVMTNFRWLAEETGAAVVIIHHERKSTGSLGKSHEGLRGHSSINAALDLALLVERKNSSREISIRSTKSRDVEVQSFGASFSFTHKEGTKELETAAFQRIDGGGVDDDLAIQAAILIEAKEPINQTNLIDRVRETHKKAGKNHIRKLAESLAAEERLKTTRGKKGAKIYQVA
jgi:hypothetical protein